MLWRDLSRRIKPVPRSCGLESHEAEAKGGPGFARRACDGRTRSLTRAPRLWEPCLPLPITYPSLSDPPARGTWAKPLPHSVPYLLNKYPSTHQASGTAADLLRTREGTVPCGPSAGASGRACGPAGGWAGLSGVGVRSGPESSLLGAGSATGSLPGCLRSARVHLSCAWALFPLGTLGPLSLGLRLCADGNVAAYQEQRFCRH